MSKSVFTSLIATSLLVSSPALAQSEDSWDTASSNGTNIAYAEYSSGQTIAVQCKGADLQVAITGLPPIAMDPSPDTTGSRITVVDSETRHPVAHLEVDEKLPTVGIAIIPARFARALQSGRPITLHAKDQPDIILAPPTDGSGVQNLLTDCGVPLSDDNDRRVMRGLPSMEVLVRAQRRFASRTPHGTYTTVTQCTVAADWKLQDCQTARQTPATPRHDQVFSASLNGFSIKPEEAATANLAVGDLVIFNYMSVTTVESLRTN